MGSPSVVTTAFLRRQRVPPTLQTGRSLGRHGRKFREKLPSLTHFIMLLVHSILKCFSKLFRYLCALDRYKLQQSPFALHHRSCSSILCRFPSLYKEKKKKVINSSSLHQHLVPNMQLVAYIIPAIFGATLGAAQCTITSAIPTCGVSLSPIVDYLARHRP